MSKETLTTQSDGAVNGSPIAWRRSTGWVETLEFRGREELCKQRSRQSLGVWGWRLFSISVQDSDREPSVWLLFPSDGPTAPTY
jgi:hypothetical protein